MNVNMEKIKEQMAKDNQRRKEDLDKKRAAMRLRLEELGIEEVRGSYDGYGDSGNSEIVELKPEPQNLSDKDKQDIEDIIWAFAYNQNPGFEINEGGRGSIKWDIPNDRLDINHVMIVEECHSYENV